MAFNSDSIATATIAKIFGSELLNIDQNVTDNRGSMPSARIDPREFLSPLIKQDKGRQQRNMMAALQAEAEAMYPLPAVQHQPAPAAEEMFVPPSSLAPAPATSVPVPVSRQVVDEKLQLTLEQIGATLERIATALETSEVSVRARRFFNKPA
jgi:hypothetical protein